MATELASAYLTLVPSLKGAQASITKELSGVSVAAAGQSMGASLSAGISQGLSGGVGKGAQGVSRALSAVSKAASGTFGKVAKAGLGTITGIATGIAGLAATGGMSRALNLEKAQTMFKGMGLAYEDFAQTIDDAVTGTVFSLDEAAVMTASLAAAGVEAGDDMAQALRGAIGAASTFGTDLDSIANVYKKVSASGKLTNETIAMLTDKGVPAISLMADYLGVAQDEIFDLAKDGKISFAQFSEAMSEAFGDSASAANETFTGSLANMKSALNRIGEKFMEPIRANSIPVFNSLRLALNEVKTAIEPLAERFASLAETVSGKAVAGIEAFTASMQEGAGILGSFRSGVDAALGEGTAAKIEQVASGIAGMAALGPVMSLASKGVSAAGKAVDGLSAAFAPVASAALAASGAVRSSVGSIVGAVGKVSGAAASASAVFARSMGSLLVPPAVTQGLSAVKDRVSSAGSGIQGVFSRMGASVSSAVGRVAPGLASFGSAVGLSASEATKAFKQKLGIGKAAENQKGILSRAMGGIGNAVKGAGSVASSAFGVFNRGLATVGKGALVATGGLAAVAGGLLVAGVGAVAAGVDVQAAFDGFLANIQALTENMPALATSLAEQLPAMAEQLATAMPALVEAFVVALQALAEVVPVVMPSLVTAITGMITALVPALVGMAPVLIDAGMQLFVGLVSALAQVLPVILAQVPNMVYQIGTAVAENLPALMEAGSQLFEGLLQAFDTMVPKLVALLPGFVSSVCGFLAENLPTLLSAGLQLFMMLVTSFIEMLPTLIESLPQLIVTVTEAVLSFMPELLEAAKDLFMKICEAVPTVLTSLFNALGELLTQIPGKIEEYIPQILEAGKNLIKGMAQGISDAAGWVFDKITELGSGVVDEVLNLFGIHSPSKVMRDLFGYVGQGMVLGLEDEAGKVRMAMRSVVDGAQDEAERFNPVLGVTSRFAAASGQGVSRSASQSVEDAVFAGMARAAAYAGPSVTIRGDVTLDASHMSASNADRFATTLYRQINRGRLGG